MREVAEKLAQTLGYECISRDILLEASEQFNIPEIKLLQAIHEAPLCSVVSHTEKKAMSPIFVWLCWHTLRKTMLSITDWPATISYREFRMC